MDLLGLSRNVCQTLPGVLWGVFSEVSGDLARVNVSSTALPPPVLTLTESSHTLHARTHSRLGGQRRAREEGPCAALRASCRSLRAGSLLPRLLHRRHRSMGLQTWPPSKPPLSPMACLDVETPSICRGKFKSGAFPFFCVIACCTVYVYGPVFILAVLMLAGAETAQTGNDRATAKLIIMIHVKSSFLHNRLLSSDGW